MKFAFSTVSCPTWDFETIIVRAKEYGYDGVEIRALADRTAANPLLIDPAKLRKQFADGSTLVTYPDGSTLIVESNLAKESVVHETSPVNYNDPPPPPRQTR